jgi:hypothetical protein
MANPKFLEVPIEGINVYSWCPAPEPIVPPTQVHLHINLGGLTLVMRFKGPDTLDAIIKALRDHRRDVFGEEPS